MGKRSNRNQTCHDISVARRAAGLRANGWRVSADIEGYKQPKTLRVSGRGVRPDIIARKGKRTKVVEVETPDTRFRDRPQHRLLRQYGRTHKNTEVNVRTCYPE